MPKWLQSLRYAIADLGYVVRRGIGRGATGVRERWTRLSRRGRGLLVGGLAAVALVVLVAALVVPNLPCSFPGGDRCAPADDAAALVPADSLAYVHANLDPATDEFSGAAEAAGALPVISRQITDRALALVPGPGGHPPRFDTDVRPWFGGELAIAVLGSSVGGAQRVVMLEAADAAGAGKFAAAITGAPRTVPYHGVDLSIGRRGVATAQVGGFLVVGAAAGVRSVIDASTGDTDSLADDADAESVRDRLPEHRFAEAWLSPEGAQALIGDSRGQLATLSALVEPGATTGVAASLAGDSSGFEVAIRSDLDPERAKASPGFFSAFPSFSPSLPATLPSDSLAYLGFGSPQRTVSALLSQAVAEAPGIAGGFENLVRRLRRGGGPDLQGQLLASLGDEAALALAPGQGESGISTPFAELVASGVDEGPARSALADLAAGVASGRPSASGTATPDQRQLDALGAHTFSVSPTLSLTYAVFDGLAAVATDPKGILALSAGDGGLDQQDAYQRATDGFGDDVSMLAYFDLARLVSIGERLGLAGDPVYATFAGDFRRLRALGIGVHSSETALDTDARLLLTEPVSATGKGPAD